MISKELLEKYDTPVPRYTSYPTVPYWSDSPTTEEWLAAIELATQNEEATWSIYAHIPFCESLCTFCGCNTVISRSHDKEGSYVQNLLSEFQFYQEGVPHLFDKPLRQLHLGGGTPTFLSAENLKFLVGSLLSRVKVDYSQFDGSLEVDPRRTNEEQLRVLFDLGFRRVSMGVQDFNEEVQRLINRTQPFKITKDLTSQARQMGYTSVNYDLIYGLPKQSLTRMRETVERTIELRPDRIALYSFALVPWIKPQQRLFKDEDLPVGAEKRELYELSYDLLTEAGYLEIGMDHFALPEDELSKSMARGELHRNFMGYAELRTDVLLGLGVSAISESPSCFHQNDKLVATYQKRVLEGEIPTLRGHKLTSEDQRQRDMILRFMTQGEVQISDPTQRRDVEEFLSPMIQDQLVKMDGEKLMVLDQGRPFLRNACMALDVRLRKNKPDSKVFSQSL